MKGKTLCRSLFFFVWLLVHQQEESHLVCAWENEDDDDVSPPKPHQHDYEYLALDMEEVKTLFGADSLPVNAIRHENFWIVEKRQVEQRLFVPNNEKVTIVSDHHDLSSPNFKLTMHDGAPGTNKTSRRYLRTYYGEQHSNDLDANDEVDGIYIAGDVSKFSTRDLNYLLRNHDKVAFTKTWKSKSRLIVTEMCTIKTGRNSEAGAYYCVDGKTVCVARKSMNRFYGQHTGGGVCGTLPLDESVVNDLPDYMQSAYENTCGEDDHCDGQK